MYSPLPVKRWARTWQGGPCRRRGDSHRIDAPAYKEGGIVILHGNLAPQGAVVKRSAVDPELWHYCGPARVFHSEQDCIDSVQNGNYREGDVLVVSYEGPVGGPGMREMHRLSNVLKALARRIALVTDGRFSGADSGLMIGYVTPEAASGGAIGIVQDGDEIEINLELRTLNPEYHRLQNCKSACKTSPRCTKKAIPNCWTATSELVGPASEGAMWRVGAN